MKDKSLDRETYGFVLGGGRKGHKDEQTDKADGRRDCSDVRLTNIQIN